MSHRVQQMHYGPIVGWTQASTGTSEFFPVTPVLETAGKNEIRIAMEMCNTTGDVTATPALITSNDGNSWSSPIPIEKNGGGALVTCDTNEVSYSTEWASVVSDVEDQLYMRIGFSMVNTTTGTHKEHANIFMRIEFRD